VLNSLRITIGLELKAVKENTAVLCIDPGTVPTRLSRGAGDIKLENSVRGMYNKIEKVRIENSGLFVNQRAIRGPTERLVSCIRITNYLDAGYAMGAVRTREA
jgi:hypothetical protein